MKRKVISFIMALVVMLLASGCGEKVSYDSTKTQLYILNYNGGFGSEWLHTLEEQFEEAYKDYKNGDKVGVDVIVDANKVKGSEFLASVKGSVYDIFVCEAVNYSELVNGEYALDITDVVTGTNSDDKTIESKLDSRQVNYYKMNDKYYAIPNCIGSYGITYNVDIWEQYSFYFKKNGCPSEALHENGSFTAYKYADGTNKDDLSAGPDGKYGTYDDGFAATYEEFYTLMDRMLQRGVTPMVWTGQYASSYINWLGGRLISNQLGLNDMSTFVDFSGTMNNVVDKIDSNGNAITKSVEINANNEDIVYNNAGTYNALKFIEKIYSDSLYSATNRSGMSTLTHTGAQQEFLASAQKDYTSNPIAMLVEGSWWENESILYGNFEKIQTAGGQSHDEMRLADMPMPHADTAHIGQEQLTVDVLNTYEFINSGIAEDKIDIAKEFLRFMNTDEKLVQFSKETNTFKALNYEISEEDLAEMSYYGQSLYAAKKANGVFYQISSSATYRNKGKALANMFVSDTYSNITSALSEKKTTAIEFFNGIVSYWSAN